MTLDEEVNKSEKEGASDSDEPLDLEQGISNSYFKKFKEKTKSFLVDTSASLIYWHPIGFMNDIFNVGFTIQESLETRAGTFLLSACTGGIYGFVLDKARKYFNNPYYSEIHEGIERKKKTPIKDGVIDTMVGMAYWYPLSVSWIYFYVGASWEEIASYLAGSVVIVSVFSAPYGKFLDWYRGKLGTGPKRPFLLSKYFSKDKK